MQKVKQIQKITHINSYVSDTNIFESYETKNTGKVTIIFEDVTIFISFLILILLMRC